MVSGTSCVIKLHDTLKITVGYKCTCADDTRTSKSTEIQNIQTDTLEMSAKNKNNTKKTSTQTTKNKNNNTKNSEKQK